MSQINHTAEPESLHLVRHECDFDIVDGNGHYVAISGAESTMRRMVDCYNALAGLNPSAVKDVVEALGAYDPWPVADLLTKLAEAAEILLEDYGYTKDRWEEISGAAKDGRVAADRIRKALAALNGKESA